MKVLADLCRTNMRGFTSADIRVKSTRDANVWVGVLVKNAQQELHGSTCDLNRSAVQRFSTSNRRCMEPASKDVFVPKGDSLLRLVETAGMSAVATVAQRTRLKT